MMRYISLFSGIEAASVAWGPLGWEPVAFAEVEPFCCELLARRFPDVPNLGDVSLVDWTRYEGSVDVIIGGSPCQAFSIAGRRGGLLDERGQLMLEYVRAVREVKPRWVVWENVPGVLSQDRGRALGTLYRELADCGYSVAHRVLDAQFFGVAQRRRRVFLVGHPRAGCVAAVLFDRASLRWDFASSREAREALAGAARRRPGAAGFKWNQGRDAGSLGYEDELSPTLGAAKEPAVCYSLPENAVGRERGGTNGPMAYGPGDPAPTLRASHHVPAVAYQVGNDRDVTVMEDVAASVTASACKAAPAVAYAIDYKQTPKVSVDVCHTLTREGEGGIHSAVVTQYGEEVAGTLTARHDSSPCADRGMNVVAVPCMGDGQGNASIDDDLCGTLSSHSAKDAPIVAQPSGCLTPWDKQSRRVYGDGGAAPALDASDFKHAKTVLTSAPDYIVRRLTPRECERLQGFPDDWTLIPYRGQPAGRCPDSPRYKALGNSMAVPVIRHLGERIQEVDAL